MSIIRLAVRIAAVHALRDATLAEGRVYDSSTTPLEATLREQPQPFLMVTTDAHERSVTERDLGHGEDTLELVIEAAIASRVTVQMPDGSAVPSITIPNTDAGMELTLDLIEAQVGRALQYQGTEWSRVFGLLVPRITRRLSRRGASAEDGLRFAARQIVLTCDPLADPVPGEALPPGGAWAAFLAAVEADADLAALAPVLRLHIEGAAAPTWQGIAALLGSSMTTVDAIGLAPLVLSNAGAAVEVEQITAEPEGPGDDLVLTEAAADAQGV